MNKKVFTVIQVMPIFEMAGAQTMCENLVMELKKNKDTRCIVITFFKNNCKIVERLKKNGIEVICLNKHRGFDVKIIFKLAYYFKKIKPNVIHTHLSALQYVYIAYLLQKNKKKIKIVHTIHNIAEKENKDRIRKIQKYLFRKGIVVPVAISKTIQESVVKEYGIDESKVPIVYNSIDLSRCIEKDTSKFNYKFINIGRMTEQKNQVELIEIFSKIQRKYPKSILYIVGKGKLKEVIEKKISALKLKKSVVIIENLESCYKILNESDVFLMTSRFEGLPMTIIEALGTGLPVVTYNVGGIKDIITDGENGFIANTDSEFLKDVEKLVENEKLRKILSQNELESSKKFNSRYMADEYLKIYIR